jgi:hypothetical protein
MFPERKEKSDKLDVVQRKARRWDESGLQNKTQLGMLR